MGFSAPPTQKLPVYAVAEKITGCQGPALKPGQTVVPIDPGYFRPAEAQQKRGCPPKISAYQMCEEMATSNLRDARRHALLKAVGYRLQVSVE
jgi:GDPmannose 4,6-dehydratase